MSAVSDIVTGIKAIVASELGGGFSELPFVLDVAKNRFAGGTKGYGVWTGQVVQASGVNGYVTVDQSFELVLTDTYGSTQTGDAAQRTAGIALHGRLEDIYVRISAEKAGVPSQVMNVTRLIATPVQFIDSNVAVLRATFDIKYRTAK